jgi:hypothetical protein
LGAVSPTVSGEKLALTENAGYSVLNLFFRPDTKQIRRVRFYSVAVSCGVEPVCFPDLKAQ